jgi:uncharacterized membrane protein
MNWHTAFFRNNILYFIPVTIYSLLFLLPTLGMNNVCDGASNEILFSQESLRTIIFKNKWDDQSPLYFVILHFWLKFFSSDPYWYRIISLLTVLITGRIFFSIGLLITKRPLASLGISFLFLVSPLATWSVYYGRMYPLIILLTSTSILYIFRYIEYKKLLDLGLFVLSNVLLIYTHFFGFFLAAFFFTYWIIVKIINYYSSHKSNFKPSELLIDFVDFFYALAIIQILILPQTLRMGILLTSLPAPHGKSMSFSLDEFIPTIANFLLIQRLHPSELAEIKQYLNYIIFTLSGFLFFSGLRHLKKHMLFCFLLFLPGSVILIYLFGTGLDFRDRYFMYLAPFLFIGIGLGAFSTLRVPNWFFLNTIYRGFTVISLLFLLTLFFFMSKERTRFRDYEYAKLAMLADRVISGKTNAYITPGSGVGMPVVAAQYQNLNKQLQTVSSNHVSTRKIFDKELSDREDFIFYNFGGKNQESILREKKLLKNGYQTLRFDLHRISADLFFADSISKLNSLVEKSTLDGEYNSSTIVDWTLKSISREMLRHSHIQSLFTSRIYKGGKTETPVFVATQNGFYPEWNFGERYWKNVKLTNMTVNGITREVIWAHPIEKSTLIVAFPEIHINNWLRIIHAIGANTKYINEVDVEVFLNNTRVAGFSSPNKAGWISEIISTREWSGKNVSITLLIRCKLQTYAHFGFNFTHHSNEPKPVRNKGILHKDP